MIEQPINIRLNNNHINNLMMQENNNQDCKIPETNDTFNLQPNNVPLEQLISITLANKNVSPGQIDQNIKECYMNIYSLRKSLKNNPSASSMNTVISNTRTSKSLMHKSHLTLEFNSRISNPLNKSEKTFLSHSTSVANIEKPWYKSQNIGNQTMIESNNRINPLLNREMLHQSRFQAYHTNRVYYPKQTIATPSYNMSSFQREQCDVLGRNNKLKPTIYPIKNRHNLLHFPKMTLYNSRNTFNQDNNNSMTKQYNTLSSLSTSRLPINQDNKEYTYEYNNSSGFVDKEQYDNLKKTLLDYKNMNNKMKETIAFLSDRIDTKHQSQLRNDYKMPRGSNQTRLKMNNEHIHNNDNLFSKKSQINNYIDTIKSLNEAIKEKDNMIETLRNIQYEFNASIIDYQSLTKQIDELNDKLNKTQSLNKSVESIIKENNEYKLQIDYLMTKIKGYEEIEKKYQQIIVENSSLKAENYSLKNK